jgi:probable HAF family extracellular repeat protein
MATALAGRFCGPFLALSGSVQHSGCVRTPLQSVRKSALPLLLGLALHPWAEAGNQTYTVIPVGTLGGDYSTARSVNDDIQITGTARSTNGQDHAFIWNAGVMSDLGTLPGGGGSAGYVINNHGQVAGYGQRGEPCGGNSTPTHALLHRDNQMLDMNVASGCYSAAFSLSDNGLVVGMYLNPSSNKYRGFLYNTGSTQFTDLGTLNWGDGSSWAGDVNAATQVVGSLFKWNPWYSWIPYVWQDLNGNASNDYGETIDLAYPDSARRFGEAWGINNRVGRHCILSDSAVQPRLPDHPGKRGLDPGHQRGPHQRPHDGSRDPGWVAVPGV